MKYLKKFNESIESLIEDSYYILSPLSDDGSDINIMKNKEGNLIAIIESGPGNIIKMNEYEMEFKQLLSFLKDYGYELDTSYVTNDSWDPVEKCHNCEYINTMINPKIKFYDEMARCDNCGFESSIDSFLDFRHKITESDLHYYIKHKYWIEEVHLIFKKI